MNLPERFASYVVGNERVFFVTTIDYRNEYAPSFDCHESGIREMTKHSDGRHYPTYESVKDVIPFVLCQHDIYPLREGHRLVVNALKHGIEPKDVYEYLKGDS